MRPIVTFYKPFAIVASFFTLFTCYLLLNWGSIYFSLTLFWIKGMSSALLGAGFHFSRPEQLHFYHNLGFTTLRLYALAALLDFSLWLIAIAISAQML